MKTKTKVITIISLIAVIAGGIFAAPYVLVKVPAAIAQAKPDQSSSALCKPFVKEGIACDVKWETSEDQKRGKLISQSRAEGSYGIKFVKNDTIILKYSKGAEEVKFPAIQGMDIEKAKKELFEVGIIVKSTKIEDNPEFEKNQVISASIEAGASVPVGTEIEITVASGASVVPDFTGKTKEEAQKIAKQSDLKLTFVEEESEEKEGTVISQTPTSGDSSSKLKNKDKIELVVAKSFGAKKIVMPNVVSQTSEEAQKKLAEAGFRNIQTVLVKNNEVTSKQVTQTVPQPGEDAGTDERIVIIVSEPIG